MYVCDTCGFSHLLADHVDSCDECAARLKKATELLRSVVAGVNTSQITEPLRSEIDTFLLSPTRPNAKVKINIAFEELSDELFEKTVVEQNSQHHKMRPE